MTIAEQVHKHFDMLLDDFAYEFYEHLEGYEESTIKDIADGIVQGIKKWASELSADAVYEQINDANDGLDPVPYNEDEDELRNKTASYLEKGDFRKQL